MKLFIGLDVSLAKTAVCVINEHGKIVKEAQVLSDPQAIVDFACGFRINGTSIPVNPGQLFH